MGAIPALGHAFCFEEAASTYRLDAKLLRAVARVESGLRPEAVNRSHWAQTGTLDVGLMQVNTSWLKTLASHGVTRADLDHPCTNVRVGAWILADSLARHGNSWEAVGAYNASCTQLKGAACQAARSRYAWRVHRQLADGEQRELSRATTREPRTNLGTAVGHPPTAWPVDRVGLVAVRLGLPVDAGASPMANRDEAAEAVHP